MTVVEAIRYQRSEKQQEAYLTRLQYCAKIVLPVESGHSDVSFPKYFDEARGHIKHFMKTYQIRMPMKAVCEILLAM